LQVLVLLLSLFLVPGLEAAAPPRTVKIVQFSDIHYGNEEYKPEAWHKAFDEGEKVRPDVFLFTGDQADNKCTPEEFWKRLDGVIGEIRVRLDRVRAPAMLVLGNNDLVKNYQTDPEVLNPTLKAYRKGLGSYYYLDELGNGVYPRVVKGITWISLNTQIFSRHNKYSGRPEQAARTLEWLRDALKALPQERPVVILVHIPPTYDLYDHSLSWLAEDLDRFLDVVRDHRGPMLIIGGHYHRNEIHSLTRAGKLDVPILLAGSLSFKYGNYPNWRDYALKFAHRGEMSSFAYRIRYPDDASWNTTWGIERPMRMASISAWITRIGDSTEKYLRYMRDLYAHNKKWESWASAEGARRTMLREVWSTVPAPAAK